MVETGLDVLLGDDALIGELRVRRVGLVTNASAITRRAQPILEALRAVGVNLAGLFSPEHGLTGVAVAGEAVASSIEPRTGLPVHSLYGSTKKPTPAMLSGIDVMLFDLQDVGARFYTYTTTLAYTLAACAENGVELIVLDRPNPIGGIEIEGPVLEAGFESFVGHGKLPIRYGLTMAELARLYAALDPATRSSAIGLRTIRMRGWQRGMHFDATYLPWAAPSPNMPHAGTALLYPGLGPAGEGANLSIGALTPLPFERIGAPWLDGETLATKMNELELPGVRFRATRFVPTARQYCYADVVCHGVQVHVMTPVTFRPIATGLHLMHTIKRMHPSDWHWNASHFDLLMGNAHTRTELDAGASVAELMRGWQAGQGAFEAARREVMLYA